MSQVIHNDVSHYAADDVIETEPAWTTWHPDDRPRKTAGWSYDHDDYVAPSMEVAIRQLFHMTVASLRGYREIYRLTLNAELHTFVDVLVHQRAAQCRSLAQMSHSLYRQLALLGPDDESLADPSAADLQITWLRAIWNFEQAEYGRFADNIEQAEAMLEDAFLGAANTFENAGVANLFRQYATNICGARQRLEDLIANLGRH